MLLITIIFLNAMLLELKLSILLRFKRLRTVLFDVRDPDEIRYKRSNEELRVRILHRDGGCKNTSMYYLSRSDPVTYNP